jgi:glycosyltransferase involved in cell wall biosynthesis
MRAERPAILLMGDTLNIGGTEGQFVEVACRLNRSKWDIHVTCLRAEGPMRARLEAAGVQAWSCGRGSLRLPRSAMAVLGLVRYLRAHCIRLVHSFDFYSNILGVPAARLAGVPVVIASQRNLGLQRSRLQGRVHGKVLRLARYVLVNSEAVAEWVKCERVVESERIVMIPNGVDFARFAHTRVGWRQSTCVTVGTLANLRPEKGVGDIIRSFALVRERCPGTRFVLWGEGSLRPELERLVHELRLGQMMELPGATAVPELALRGLDIFVLPSLSEGFSNALLEAMATGLPVVATCVGGNLSLVEDEETGLLVPPGDPASLAKAVIRLIEDPALAAKLAVRGQDRVRAEFDIDRMVARFDALYERALAGNGN